MKKLNKFFAVLVALAMMATLCVCMAFAADPVTPDAGANAKECGAPGFDQERGCPAAAGCGPGPL